MASAIVGSPRFSCQRAIGSWLVTMVERSPALSSTTSSRSAAALIRKRLNGKVIESRERRSSPGPHETGQPAIGPTRGVIWAMRRGVRT